jgi:hypothetical protein
LEEQFDLRILYLADLRLERLRALLGQLRHIKKRSRELLLIDIRRQISPLVIGFCAWVGNLRVGANHRTGRERADQSVLV